MNIENYPSHVQPLLQLLQQVHPLSTEIANYITEHAEQVRFTAGELLQESGHPNLYTSFILKGAIRGFIREDKKEVTTWISINGELATSISAIDSISDALENMQAIEDCLLVRFPNEALHKLYDIHPEFNIIGRKVLQVYYRDAERRAFLVRLSKAENKYLFFLEHYPHLSNRIQLQYIASFLGITMETLSRVRRKISYA